MLSQRSIGIFDSGIGGLTVLRKLQNALPHEHFVYFADTANLPYGEKTPEQIINYAQQTLSWMQNEMGVKLAVAACHTSSTTALDIVSPHFSIPIIGTIYPMVEALLEHHQNERLGIIATPTSVQSRMHERILKKAGFEGEIFSISCPKFVPIIETGRISGPELIRTTTEYLEIFKTQNLNTLVYGCTHYPWIADIVEQILPTKINFIDPAEHIAKSVSQELYKHKMLNTSWNKLNVDFYCSGSPNRFAAQINLLLSIPVPKVTQVNFTSSEWNSQKFAVNQ
ncbi:MAG: glutamate racemase [Alphaproteobacteria bacterium]|nr:glutamate racemase [Alphaproteobacteria bacterium]